MDNLLARAGQLISPMVDGFIGKMKSERGEVVIPFIESIDEAQRPAVQNFVTNTGATTEDLAGYDSFDKFLAEYKPKTPNAPEWTTALEPEHKALVGVKGWKTPADTIKGYSELEKLVGHEKIAMPKKDKDGNYDKADFERVMTQLGLPKDIKEYKESENFKLPEGLTINEALKAEFRTRARAEGILPGQYKFMMDELSNMMKNGSMAESEAKTKEHNEAMLNLRSKWGLGYDQKVKMANAILANYANDPAKSGELLKKYGNDPALIEILANIGGDLSEDGLQKANMSATFMDPAAAKLEINKIREERAKELNDNTHPQHDYWVKKLDELYHMVG